MAREDEPHVVEPDMSPDPFVAQERAAAIAEADRNPNVVARIMARHYSIKWEHVSEFAEGLEVFQSHWFANFSPEPWSVVRSSWDFSREIFSKCGSPIEELFLAHLAKASKETFRWHNSGHCSWVESGTVITPQKQIESYRVDFAFEGEGVKVVVELDGHEFHERTAEQATKDKSRDRRLQELGWKVIRFTGREVWRKPWDTANEVIRIVTGKPSKLVEGRR